MDTTIVIKLTGSFLQAVGETLAELKRQDIAELDLELLRLKRGQLVEKLEDFKSELAEAARIEKGKISQDLVDRGLRASSVALTVARAFEQDASRELDRAVREYNRALEEIAIMERRVAALACPWWKRIWRCILGGKRT